MADRNSPVGVFDSGIGGLTVAREIIRQIPDEADGIAEQHLRPSSQLDPAGRGIQGRKQLIGRSNLLGR